MPVNTTALTSLNVSNTDPRLISVDDVGSLTRVNISGWNKADIESMFFKEVGLDKIIAQTKEARMAGSAQRTLQDLILSRHAPLKMGSGEKNQSIIQPFRLVPRRNRINPGYFRISGGDSTGVANAAHWRLRVNNGSIDGDSSFLLKSPNSALKNIEKYFLAGHYITVEYLDTATKVAKTAVMRVISSTNINANEAYVFVAPNKTYANDSAYGGNNAGSGPDWWGAASAGDKALYQPTAGVVKIQVNSVSNYESYGATLPGYNDLGLIEYWRQTHRWCHKYNDQYVAALEAATTSEGLKKFRLLPLAKLRAQQQAEIERAEQETFFYGEAITEQQTLSTWDKLPTVYDPAWAASGESGTVAIEYKSNTLGIRTQIAAGGNVLDKQGQRLDIDDLLYAGYMVKRERDGESQSGSVSDIDIMTDQLWTRPTIRQLMMKYYKAKYGIDNLTMFAQVGQKITFNGAVVFEYDTYDIPDYGYRLNVFSDLFFDDRIAQFGGDQKSRGRAIWMIDWSDIAVNVFGSMSVNRTNNLADDHYKYVMTPNVQHVLLNSKSFEVAVGNTNRHRLIENFSDEPPKLTVPGFELNA
jgi:hypothetical protein